MNKSTQRIQRRGNNFSNAATTTIKRIRKCGNDSELRQHEQVEKALRESEEKFRNLFEHARDMIVLLDSETKIILDINTAGCNLLGLPKEKIIGKHISEFHPPELVDKYKQLFGDHVQKGSVITEDMIVQRADGVQIPMDISASVVKLSDKTIIQSVFRDVTERARMEQTLRQSEAKYSSLVERSNDGIIIIENGILKFINAKMAEMTGFTREEAVGKKFIDFSPPEEKQKLMEIHMKRMSGEGVPTNYEATVMARDGRRILVEVNACLITYEGRPAVMAIIRDINERKQIEHALKESEEKFSKAFLNSPEIFVISNMEDDTILEVNNTFVRLTGYTREEVIGKKNSELGTWAVPEERTEIVKILKEKGIISNRECQFRMKSGEINTRIFSAETININNKPCMLCVTTDITERKRMEKALREREKRFSDIAENTLEWIWEVDVNGKYTYSSPVVEKILGYKPEEILEKYFYSFFLPEEREELKKAALEVFAQKQPFNGFINRNIHKNGKTVDLLTSGVPIIDKEGNLLGYRGVDTDITERKKMEEAVRESEEFSSSLLQNAPNPIEVINPDTSIRYVNQAFEKLTGFTSAEIAGRKAPYPWWPEEQQREIGDALKKDLASNNITRKEIISQNKNGERSWVAISTIPIKYNGTLKYFLVNWVDITERKRMEQALKESEEKFSKAFHASPEAIVISKIEDGTILEANDTFLRHTGYTLEEIINKKSAGLSTWAMPKERAEMINILKEKGGVSNQEYHFRTKSGEIRIWIFSAEIININNKPCMLSVTTDITERKRMEQALKESEEKFSKAFHASPEAIALTIVEDERFIDINESYTRITGYSREELIGNTANSMNIWPTPEDHTKMRKMMQEQGRIYNEEFDFRTKSGEIRTRLLSLEPITINGEPCTISVSTDITERKKMEEAVRESEEFSSSLLQNAPNPIEVINPDTSIRYVNQALEKLTGFTSAEIAGRKAPYPWWPEERQREIGDALKKDLASNNITRKEIISQNKNGERSWVAISTIPIKYNGTLKYFLVNWVDITERKRMEQALRESEEKFSKAFLASPEEVTIARMKDNIFIDVNESFCRNNGYTREEAIGHKGEELDLLIGPSQRDQVTKIVKERGLAKNIELECRDKSGETRTLLFSADIINLGGEPCQLTIANDISQRKQAERKLKEALADLEQSSALLKATNKELESFSYSVSHDLRSPLRSIDGFSQALLEDYSTKLNEKGQDYLNRLRNASQKMGELIDGILKLSRLTRSETHHEEVNLTSLANEIATRLQETHDKRDVKFIIGNDLTAIGDPQMLRVLLENLLGNAWKFTKNTKQARIEFGSTTDGERKTFFIKDNGAGFDMGFKDKLFGAFQRLHDAAEFPGTGIGLATVQRIINRHGGSIRAEGAVGKGATFYFTLN